MNRLDAIRAFLMDIVHRYPYRMAVVSLLLMVLGLTEGIGLILLGPLVLAFSDTASEMGDGMVFSAIDFIRNRFTAGGAVGLLFAALIVRTGIAYLVARLSVSMQTDYLHQNRMDTYDAVRRARWSFLSSKRTSDITYAMTHRALELSFGLEVVARAAVAAAVFVAGVVLAFLISPAFTSIALAATLAIAVPMVVFEWRAFRLGAQEADKLGEVYAGIEKRIDDLKMTKFFDSTDPERIPSAGGLTSLSDNHRQLLEKLYLGQESTRTLHQLAGITLLTGLVAYFLQSDAPVPEIVLFILVFVRILPKAQNIHSSARRIFELAPVHAAFRDLVDECRKNSEVCIKIPGRIAKPFAQIALTGVHFAYPARPGTNVITGLDLVVEAGSSLAIVGRSGAGKTTLMDLIAGLLSPDKGRILVDGVSLKESDLSRWRNRVSLVTQNTYAETGTIRENIELGAAETDPKLLEKVIADAGLKKIIGDLPGGLDTDIGKSGQLVSRGERQRIALARALARQPELLILDEATSALNPVDEAAIIEHLKNLECTILIVAHRLSSVLWADNVAVIDAGTISEYGSPVKLANKRGSFLHAMRVAGNHEARPSRTDK